MADPTAPSRPAGRTGFAGSTVLVCGTGMAGRAAVAALLAAGARCLVTDDRPLSAELPAGAEFLGSLAGLPAGVAAVVTSPGLPPRHPVLAAAVQAGVPVLGELEFAWRLQQQLLGAGGPSWLMVTGTNGKTTTVRMLESMLIAAGRRAIAVGNVGVSVIEAVQAEPPHEVMAVEASSFQLHFSDSIFPLAGALLNLAEDHLDWHGSMSAYAADKAKVWNAATAVGNAEDPLVRELLARRDGPVVRFGLQAPAPGEYGVRDGLLIDPDGAELVPVSEVRPAGSHNVANALAAAALARAAGVTPDRIAAGLRAFVPDPHRNEFVAELGGIRYVDDSKATNPHAAAASLGSYRSIVWIAGGQLKGADVEPLVAEFAGRLAAVVLLGVDRDKISIALARHAPDLPVIEVARTDDGAMQETVAAATSLARAGDVVLLAPAAASKDMFASYGERGAAFQRAVRELADPPAGS
jgi:UDP-N-acetylmuramoylalanine--D-glutamate ligase